MKAFQAPIKPLAQAMLIAALGISVGSPSAGGASFDSDPAKQRMRNSCGGTKRPKVLSTQPM